MIPDSRVIIAPEDVARDSQSLGTFTLNELYRRKVGDYPKFFKMDPLCKLAFLGAELLLGYMDLKKKRNGAVILFNREGSLHTDRNYQKTLAEDNYFPSPALFVYTLANIATGEIAIRHKIQGETSFYIMEDYDEREMEAIIKSTFQTSNPSFILTGWVEYHSDTDYFADMQLYSRPLPHKPSTSKKNKWTN